jgi:hypothetical protein
MEKVGFGLTGIAWNVGSWFLPDWNGLELETNIRIIKLTVTVRRILRLIEEFNVVFSTFLTRFLSNSEVRNVPP